MTESDGPSAPLSKTQFVYEWLKEEILSGSLTPGSRIRQQDVARTLGVSYTPVREAIRQLQATGLITYEPNRGNAVNSLGDDALRELYLLRGVVEGLGARLAAEKMTDAVLSELRSIHEQMLAVLDEGADASALAALSRNFHSLIVKAGGPHIVHPKTQEIWTHYPVPRSQSLWGVPGEARRSVDAHARILDALQARDALSAGSLMEEHIADGVRFRLGGDS
ncbi:DNA-binding GntR family transcriptional regulator [Homoserinimonas aerilata]|uniref:DNA-binding GntR family transcriptional regulator n=1 Tax=Homoserinimonas aerilata TaxID=1162970 RepID=A0A542YAP0_9MICO|nr:GntR family transcriptional regulator [Homoserinimonas aerilata]TQL45024.1 DNA-binding GntR family transcriptional regulator [Homoserinimonas aerilata]